MFTLKHIHHRGETIMEAREPALHYRGESSNGTDYEVTYLNEHGVTVGITGGIVYVMNEKGATVGKYDLEAMRREGRLSEMEQYVPTAVGSAVPPSGAAFG